MPNTVTLSLLAGLSIAGAGLGLGLGRAAVHEINPAYFQEEGETSFLADKVPYRSPDWSGVQSAEYQQPPTTIVTQDAAMPASCIGCRNYPIEYVPQHDRTIDLAYAEPAPRRARPLVETVETVAVEQAPDPARDRIARYSSYPVSREEADAAAPTEDDAATQ